MVSVHTGSLLKSFSIVAFGLSVAAASILNLSAQAPAPAPAQAGRGGRGGRGGTPQAPVISPEVSEQRRITFRISAPQAQAVRLNASDIPGLGQTATLSKGEN